MASMIISLKPSAVPIRGNVALMGEIEPILKLVHQCFDEEIKIVKDVISLFPAQAQPLSRFTAAQLWDGCELQ